MRHTITLLYRMILIAGVLVALTPCGLCQKSQMSLSAHCAMGKNSSHDCCHHSKSSGPLCKVMDQSSLAVASVHLDVPAVHPIPAVFSPLSVAKTAVVAPLFFSGSSSPPGFLPLRI